MELYVNTANAQTTKCTDVNGKITYTQFACGETDIEVKFGLTKEEKIESENYARSSYLKNSEEYKRARLSNPNIDSDMMELQDAIDKKDLLEKAANLRGKTLKVDNTIRLE